MYFMSGDSPCDMSCIQPAMSHGVLYQNTRHLATNTKKKKLFIEWTVRSVYGSRFREY